MRAAALGALVCLPVRPSDEEPGAPYVVTQAPLGTGRATGAAERLPDGARLVLVDTGKPGAEPRNLAPGFAAAGRADVAEDARHVLFVARRAPGDVQQVFELALDGGEPRQVTRRATDCFSALYLSTLFTIDAQAPEPRLAICARATDGTPQLFLCRPDGSDERQITFFPEGACAPAFLTDGRLVCVRGGAQGGALFAVNVDGTDVQLFAGARNVAPVPAWETLDGRVLYVERGAAADALCAVDLVRPLRTRAVRTEVRGRILAASASPGSGAVVLAADEAGGIDLLQLPPAQPGTDGILDLSRRAPIDVRPLTPRAHRPGRSSVVDERVDYGFLYVLDVLQSDLVPGGRLPGGSARTVEVLASVADAKDGTREAVLGSAPVSDDGSLYLQVPARTPLRLRTLDADGRVTQEMQSWIWVMPKEARGCIGCHEDRELTPPNRHVQALRRAPRQIGGAW